MSKISETKIVHFDNYQEEYDEMLRLVGLGWILLGYGSDNENDWYFTAIFRPEKQKFSMKYREDLARTK